MNDLRPVNPPPSADLPSLIRLLKTPDERTQQAALAQAKSMLGQPVSQEWLVGRVQTMLSHYFRPETDPRLERSAMADWRKALSPYPQPVVEEAVDEWLRTQSRRPCPADITSLCVLHRRRVTDLFPKPALVETEKPPVSAERAAEIMAEVRGLAARKRMG